MTDLASPAHVAQAGNVPTGETKWIRSAADVSGLVNNSNESRSNARIVIAIALGGVFLDAYDLGALAFGIKDVTREFQLTPAGTGMVASASSMETHWLAYRESVRDVRRLESCTSWVEAGNQ